MKRKKSGKSIGGFTLIEVIVSLVLVAILGTLLFTILGSSLSQSAQNLIAVRTTYDVSTVVENMTSHYKELVALYDESGPTPLAALSSAIGNEGSSYNNDYGKYKVVGKGYVTFACTPEKNCSGTPGGSSLLKVTIADPTEKFRITTLYAQQAF
ncbi:MAG: type II secretion system GspH family protein [Syntrophales bacterium]|jgi:prepilin-type N-terminal cleavage/methylation domain-containing protein|nr:type II secretion system GspH family protein [Syntrophales bacterium]MCK9528799.1 type II secretion system GspH family protein [Syntrophales bacterium]MDX9922746.1 type II secretion system protein [Syntrophales bacterium]